MNDTRQCEAQTLRGNRCKREAVTYIQHTDKKEYLACSLHANENFSPAIRDTAVKGRRRGDL